MIGQWTTTKKPEQAYFIQTQASHSQYNDNQVVKKKSNVVAKKRKGKMQHANHGQGSSTSGSRDGYRFSCDHCALTFIDPKEAIEHISQTHMPSKSSQEHQYEQETTIVQPEPAPEQLQVDLSGHHVRHHGQQQVLLLVDDNELVEEDQTHTYRIQYTTEPPQSVTQSVTVPQQSVNDQIITQEMGRKVEMIKAARTQKRLAKLQQQSMKQQNRQKSTQLRGQFIDKKQKSSKLSVASQGRSLGSEMRKRKQAQPQQHTQLRAVQIEQAVHEQQVDQVMHINQLGKRQLVDVNLNQSKIQWTLSSTTLTTIRCSNRARDQWWYRTINQVAMVPVPETRSNKFTLTQSNSPRPLTMAIQQPAT